MNDRLKAVLSDMAVFEDYNKRPWPAKAYRTAVKALGDLDFEVDDAEQVKDVPGIGEGIYKKIDSFLKTGTFPRYEEFKSSAAAQMKEIAAVKGIGMNKAKVLYAAGIHSVEDLKKAVDGLMPGEKIPGTEPPMTFTSAMKIGLEYEAHTDKTRMSIGEHARVAEPIISAIEKMPGVSKVSAAGSARRFDGSEGYTVGDIDIIVGVDGMTAAEGMRQDVEGLLDDVIMSGPTKISGIKDRRQVDVRIVPIEDYGALLLHATGPASFNVHCRKLAMKKGMTLNEYGLFDSKTKKCLCKDEAGILDMLGLGWVDPKDRKNY